MGYWKLKLLYNLFLPWWKEEIQKKIFNETTKGENLNFLFMNKGRKPNLCLQLFFSLVKRMKSKHSYHSFFYDWREKIYAFLSQILSMIKEKKFKLMYNKEPLFFFFSTTFSHAKRRNLSISTRWLKMEILVYLPYLLTWSHVKFFLKFYN
jgi:hypothetical protein